MIDEYERYLREQLVSLQREYAKAAQPILDRLVEIESYRPPLPVCVPAADSKAMADLLVHGTGVVRIDEKGEHRHIPYSEFCSTKTSEPAPVLGEKEENCRAENSANPHGA